jgi:hypothetical protein
MGSTRRIRPRRTPRRPPCRRGRCARRRRCAGSARPGDEKTGAVQSGPGARQIQCVSPQGRPAQRPGRGRARPGRGGPGHDLPGDDRGDGGEGLLDQPRGKTPAATLYSAILRELQTKAGVSRFVKTERGKFGRTSAACSDGPRFAHEAPGGASFHVGRASTPGQPTPHRRTRVNRCRVRRAGSDVSVVPNADASRTAIADAVPDPGVAVTPPGLHQKHETTARPPREGPTSSCAAPRR